MRQVKSDAVSPVVGVMLMLVVTIIIAAVVSAFAGGFGSNIQKTPQASVVATPLVQTLSGDWNYPPNYPSGEQDNNGILFENKGGDTFSLNDISIQLVEQGSGQGVSMTVYATDTLPAITCLQPGITNGGYFQKIGNTTPFDTAISPGDKFMFYADNNQFTNTTAGNPTGELLWHAKGWASWGYAPLNNQYTYTIIDTKTHGAISTGEFLLK